MSKHKIRLGIFRPFMVVRKKIEERCCGWGMQFALAKIFIVLILGFLSLNLFAQSNGDYRTRNNGNWNSSATWEIYDGGWRNMTGADKYPGETSTPSRIDIDHNVTLNVSPANFIGDLYINSGTLQLSFYDLTISGITNVSGTLTDNSNTGIVAFLDQVTINAIGSWNTTSVTTSSRMQLYGNLINNSTNVYFGGVRVFNSISISGTGTTYVNTYFNFNDNYTVTNYSTVIISGVLDPTASGTGGTWINELNSTLKYSNTATTIMSNGTLNATANPNIVEYNGTDSQTIKSTTYHHLTCSNSGTKTSGGNLIVNGDFTLSGGTYELNNSASAYTLTINGNYNQTGGVFDFNSFGGVSSSDQVFIAGNFSNSAGASSIITNGSNTYNGSFIFNGAGTQTLNMPQAGAAIWVKYFINSGSTVQLLSNLTLSSADGAAQADYQGELNISGTIDLDTYVVSQSGGIAGTGEFNLNSGAKLITANATGVQGSVSSSNMDNTFSSSADYEFQGASTGVFTTSPTANTVNNLIINNATGVTQSQNFNVTGDCHFQSGAFTLNGNTLNLNGTTTITSGTITGSSSSSIGIGSSNNAGMVLPSISGGLQNFTVNKTGTDNSVTLSSNLYVGTLLTMINGNIKVNGNSFYLSNTSAASLSYSGGTVIGAFERAIGSASTYLYPLGDATGNNHYASITVNTLDASGSLIFEFIAGDPGSTGLPLEENSLVVSSQHTTGYWSALAQNSFSTSDFDLDLNASTFSDINLGSRIIKRTDGGSWTLDGTHTDATGNIVKRSSLTGDIHNASTGTQFCIGKTKPKISVQPTDQTDICVGASAGFSITASGRIPLTYQWYKVGSPDTQLTDVGDISGATSDNLTISNIELADAGGYYCIVTDDASNTARSDTADLIVDSIDPSITCSVLAQQDVTTNSACTYVHSGTGWDASATDNCTVSSVEYSLSGDSNGNGTSLDGVTFNLGTTLVTWTATDNAGNTDVCSFNVVVTDDENPTITCAADQSQTADAGVCEAAVTVTAPTTDDNCGVATVVNDYNGTADASDTYPVGTTTVTWTVTDIHGNTNTCTQDITVTDDENPTITCAADQSQT
ncbi:MAG: HYR domain-containing protein, partial [Bacteroidetes bacterium]|nr:HYR domain-containing protein [Bacteroidota bacterium]